MNGFKRMAESPNANISRKMALAVTGILAAAAAAAVFFVVVVPVRRESERGPVELETVLRDQRRNGFPVSPAKLQAPLPPPDLNAAPFYSQLAALMMAQHLQPEIDQLRPSGDDRTADINAVRGFLAKHRAAVRLVHEASSRPACVFVRSWAFGPWTRYPELPAVRAAAWLVSLESLALAKDCRYADAVRNQRLGFRIASHASSDPVLLAYYDSLACEAIPLRGLAAILQEAKPGSRIARLAVEALRHRPPAPDLARALAGEAIIMKTGVDIAVLGRTPPGFPDAASWAKTADETAAIGRSVAPPHHRSPESRRWVIGLVQAAEARQMEDMQQLIEAARQPYPERLRRFDMVAAAVQRRSRERSAFDALTHPGADLIDLGTLTITSAASTEVRVVARQRIVQAAAEILAYRDEHGVYPLRLDQANAASLLNPYTGRRLEYRRTADGFTVSCVAPSTDVPARATPKPLIFVFSQHVKQTVGQRR